MKNKALNLYKIESVLIQKIRKIYQDNLNRQLNNISYKLADNTLMITMEGVITSSEKLLNNNNRPDLAEQVREEVDTVIYSQIRDSIEEALDVKVVDFLGDTTIEHDLTGAIAVLEFKLNDA